MSQAIAAPEGLRVVATIRDFRFGNAYRRIADRAVPVTLRNACREYSRALGNLDGLQRQGHLASLEGIPAGHLRDATLAAREAEWMAAAGVRAGLLSLYRWAVVEVDASLYWLGTEYKGEVHAYARPLDGVMPCRLCSGVGRTRDVLQHPAVVVACPCCRGSKVFSNPPPRSIVNAPPAE